MSEFVDGLLARADTVLMLQGATTMPIVRKEPLAIDAPMSRSS